MDPDEVKMLSLPDPAGDLNIMVKSLPKPLGDENLLMMLGRQDNGDLILRYNQIVLSSLKCHKRTTVNTGRDMLMRIAYG